MNCPTQHMEPQTDLGHIESHPKSSLIIYIIHISLPLSVHLLSSSPQIQLPLRLIGKVAISTQLRLWYQWGMQLIWIISLPHVVNNRLTGGRIQEWAALLTACCQLWGLDEPWTKSCLSLPLRLSLPLNVLSTASVLPGTHAHAINNTCTKICWPKMKGFNEA